MTANQIAAVEAAEARRHNREQEDLTRAQIAETKRHNTAQEGENSLHNRISEAEIGRHDFATEVLTDFANVTNRAHYERQDIESQRHNTAVEGETTRHNVEQENVATNQWLTSVTSSEGTYMRGRAAADLVPSQEKLNKSSTVRNYVSSITDVVRAYDDYVSTGVNSASKIAGIVQGFIPGNAH